MKKQNVLFTAIAVLTAFSTLPANADIAGETAGQFAVQRGAATYTIPLSLPPGLGEMQPELSLSYSSHAGDGPLGQGWSISGLSSISLCAKTVAQENEFSPVSLNTANADKRFCLDGQRLVRTGGSYGTTQLVMRTEIDSFARIIANGWTYLSSGPESFTVKTKSAQTITYGSTAASRSTLSGTTTAFAWMADRIEDAAGNYITFSYQRPPLTMPASSDTAETLISEIQYTGNPTGGAPLASVRFLYSDRQDIRHYAAVQRRVERRKRLDRIEMRVQGNLIRSYSFGYAQSARSGASLLTSIQECAGAQMTDCVPATRFDWNDTAVGLASKSVSIPGPWGAEAYRSMGDFNGDGRADLASPNGTNVEIKLGRADGNFNANPYSVGIDLPDSKWIRYGDFDGDGRTDIVGISGSNILLKQVRDSAFVGYTTTTTSSAWGPSERLFAADMNGDGRMDLVAFTGTSVRVHISTGTTFTAQTWSHPNVSGASWGGAGATYAGDFNSDGVMDFATVSGSQLWFIITNPLTKTFSWVFGATISGNSKLRWIGDFDGDGHIEFAYCSSSNVINTVRPASERPGTPAPTYNVSSHQFYFPDNTWTGDFNGDGRTDIVTILANQLVAYMPTSSSTYVFRELSVASSNNASYRKFWSADFNGDGLQDILSTDAAGGNAAMFKTTVATSAASAYSMEHQVTPLAISRIRSGTGALVSISYLPATDEAVYTKGPATQWPNINTSIPVQLVFEVQTSHGAGAPEDMRGTRYSYVNFYINTAGRGPQGFEYETTRDLLTGDYEVTQYMTEFPFSGMIKRLERHLSNGTLVERRVNFYLASDPTPSTKFPYASATTETNYDLLGAPLVETTTLQQQVDAYGNFGKLVTTTRDGQAPLTTWSRVTTTNTYTNQFLVWNLGRLTRSDVLHESSWASPIAKSASFIYDQSTGLLTSEVVEPDAVGTPRYLRTDYQYDAWGNKSQVSVSGFDSQGVALPVRTTKTTYSIQGDRLRAETLNALNHSSRQDLSLAHGGVVEAVDVNGQRTLTEYDTFGRVKRKVSYNLSGSEVWKKISHGWASGGTVPNAVTTIVESDSSGRSIISHQDLLGRTIEKSHASLDGRYVSEYTRFDEQGRTVEAGRPSFDRYSAPKVLTTYDALNRITSLDAPGPDGGRAVTSYSYNGHSSTATNAAGVSRIEYRNALGKTVRVEEGNTSASTNYEYDSVGNLIKTTDPVGQISTVQYDLHSRKIAVSDPATGNWAYSYNSFGEIERQTDAKQKTIRMEYDVLGRMIKRYDHGSQNPTIWTYDTSANGIGLLASVTEPTGYIQSISYNALSLVSQVDTTIPAAGAASVFTIATLYDEQNRPWKITRPGGFITENVFNSNGYLEALRSPKETGGELYNDAGLADRVSELTPIISQNQSDALYWHTQALDSLNAAVLAESQIASLSVLPGNVQAQVTALRNEAQTLRENAEMFSSLGEEYDRRAAYYSEVAEFYLDLIADPYYSSTYWNSYLTVVSNGLNERAAADSAFADVADSIAQAFLTNEADKLQQAQVLITQALASVQGQINTLKQQAQQHRQLAAQRQAQAKVKQDAAARFGRQLAMAQKSLSDPNYIVWWRAGSLDAEGRPNVEVYGNGVFTNREYDPGTGQLLTIRTGEISDGTIQDVGYSYDAMNNVRSRWDINIGLTANYGYDALDRLTSATISHNDSSVPLNKSFVYAYDAAGNFSSVSENGVSRAYTYVTEGVLQRKRLNNVSGVGALVHDANGNITSSGARSFSWDSDNRPINLVGNGSNVSYTYGPDGNRISKSDSAINNNNLTIYVPGGYERTTRQGGGAVQTEHRYFLMAGDRLVGSRIVVDTGSVSVRRAEYYHQDALGSIDVVTDSLGRIAKRYHYEPFGRQVDITPLGIIDPGLLAPGGLQSLLQRGYTGHEHIAAMGLIHMNGRVYDTLTGRFLSADPHVQSLTSTQGLNRYSYVQNNPLKYTDPSGYFLKSLFKKLKRLWRPLLAIAIAVFAPELLPFLGSWGAQFAGGFFGGLIMGQGDLQAGLVGGLTALAFFGVGEAFSRYRMLSDQRLLKVIAHGGVGGLSSVASGGKFGHGFLASGFTQAFAPGIDRIDRGNSGISVARTAAAAVVGGTASAMGGGKFANGAVTGAFSRAFNDEKHFLEKAREYGESFAIKAKEYASAFSVRVGGAMAFHGTITAGPGEFSFGPKVAGGIGVDENGLGFYQTLDINVVTFTYKGQSYGLSFGGWDGIGYTNGKWVPTDIRSVTIRETNANWNPDSSVSFGLTISGPGLEASYSVDTNKIYCAAVGC